MKKVVLVNAGLAAALSAVLDSSRYRIMECDDFNEEELRLTGASIDACILDVDLTTVEPIRQVEKLRRLLPQCPVIIYASETDRRWEEEAYLLKVSHVLDKPMRERLLNSLLDRLCTDRAPAEEKQAPPTQQKKPAAEAPGTGQVLRMLHKSCSILRHSLSAELLLEEFLIELRERLCINRAAVFLRAIPGQGNSQLFTSACAFGISPLVLEHAELTLDSGIGGHVFRSGRILRRNSAEVKSDHSMAREFDLLGVRVAIPILDQESVIGVAMLDERITGETIPNEELALIFSLLEQLGPAIQNCRWHEQVSAQHEMMKEILCNIQSGCVVVGQDLNVLHANDRARALFPRSHRPSQTFDLSDLPQIISGKVFKVLKTGQAVLDFKCQAVSAPGKHFQITITPLPAENSPAPRAALLEVGDCTAADRSHQSEIETANPRLAQMVKAGNGVLPAIHPEQGKDELAQAIAIN